MTHNDTGDGIEIKATIKSLALLLYQGIVGRRTITSGDIRYFFIKQINDLLQFAYMGTTITKLQETIKTLECAIYSLDRNSDAMIPLRNAWRLMQKNLSYEEIIKRETSQIELQHGAMQPIILSGSNIWEQANHILQEWSTPENEKQQVEYTVNYNDEYKDRGWLTLPSFYKFHSGTSFQIQPALDLGTCIIAALKERAVKIKLHSILHAILH